MPPQVSRPKDTTLLATLKEQAQETGLLGPAITRAEPPATSQQALEKWLAGGYHGEMAYMARLGGERAKPRTWAAWARSLALFADPYPGPGAFSSDSAYGMVSRYARGLDYHHILKKKLTSLCTFLQAQGRKALPFVDSSPLMEKALAAAGGLGWFGKNGNLLRRKEGSYFFLGGLATDADWPTTPAVQEGCGDCSACLPACPTGAIISPGVVDARRCISYLTIELKGAIPPEMRPLLGNRIFGCDDCQEICPWNERPVVPIDPAYGARSGMEAPRLTDLAWLTESQFLERFRGTPIRRAKWKGFLRNVMVALGNWRDVRALPALKHGLSHPEPLVRQHAAWALGQVGGKEARTVLEARDPVERDSLVKKEIREQLNGGEL